MSIFDIKIHICSACGRAFEAVESSAPDEELCFSCYLILERGVIMGLGVNAKSWDELEAAEATEKKEEPKVEAVKAETATEATAEATDCKDCKECCEKK